MTDVIPWTLALGKKGLRDINKDKHCLLSMFKGCWNMTGIKKVTASLDHTQLRYDGSVPGTSCD